MLCARVINASIIETSEKVYADVMVVIEDVEISFLA